MKSQITFKFSKGVIASKSNEEAGRVNTTYD